MVQFNDIMDRTVVYLFILQLTTILHQINACYFSDSQNRTICNSFIEAAAESNDEWYNLLVENKVHPLKLKPNSFLRMSNLLKLQLSNLKSIQPGAFNGLKKLDFLVFFQTELEEIPAEVYKGLNIRNLQIYDNPKFKVLPPKYFDNLPEIKHVEIRKANLGVIKADIFNGSDIYKIYLASDHIHTIEDNAFADMEGLGYLSFTDNELKKFESKRILGRSDSIKQLWLRQNQLTKIDTELLEGVPGLQKLYIAVNDISNIEPEVFSLIPLLDFLDISNNKLVEMSPNIFPSTGMKALKFLFLHNNRFTFLDKAIFDRASLLHYITYGGNPLQCTCSDEIIEITDQKNITRLCEDIYSLGERPTCITYDFDIKHCVYDANLTASLYEDFAKALEEYPVLQQHCDTTKGVQNARLTQLL